MRKFICVVTALSASTAAWCAELNKTELPKMHATFAANPARFTHNYVGKPFEASMPVANITENADNRGHFIVTLGDKSEITCGDVPADDALAFNKGDTVDVTGAIADHTPEGMKLDHCAFMRSVPVDEVTAAPTNTFQAPQAPPAQTPRPQSFYVPPAPPVSAELRRIYGKSLYFYDHHKWWVRN